MAGRASLEGAVSRCVDNVDLDVDLHRARVQYQFRLQLYSEARNR